MKHPILLLLVLAACSSTPPPKPQPPDKSADCEAACEHLRGLDCALGEPTPEGNTCEHVCEKLEANGVRFISCTIDVTTCAMAEHCE